MRRRWWWNAPQVAAQAVVEPIVDGDRGVDDAATGARKMVELSHRVCMTTHSIIDPAITAALPGDGIGTRADWLRAGVSHRMFADGRLRRVARGLYVAGDDARAVTAERIATVLPDDAVIGGWAAALAYGVRDAGPTMLRATGDDILVYPGRHQHKKTPGTQILRSDVRPDEIAVIDGVRYTNPARTAYDMARFAPSVSAAVGLLDCFLFDGNPQPLSIAQVSAVLGEHLRSRGNARARAAIAMASPRSRSISESQLRARLVRDVGLLPANLAVNASLRCANSTYELDLVDLTCGLVLEYDGHHHADAAQRARDSRKDVAVDELGLLLLRVNAPLLHDVAELVRVVERRRGVALARGGAQALDKLLRDGRLAERTLPIY